jgi:hypothetical protein
MVLLCNVFFDSRGRGSLRLSKTHGSQTYKNHLVVRTPLYRHTTITAHAFSPNKTRRYSVYYYTYVQFDAQRRTQRRRAKTQESTARQHTTSNKRYNLYCSIYVKDKSRMIWTRRQCPKRRDADTTLVHSSLKMKPIYLCSLLNLYYV